jgi:hypothetical protein
MAHIQSYVSPQIGVGHYSHYVSHVLSQAVKKAGFRKVDIHIRLIHRAELPQKFDEKSGLPVNRYAGLDSEGIIAFVGKPIGGEADYNRRIFYASSRDNYMTEEQFLEFARKEMASNLKKQFDSDPKLQRLASALSIEEKVAFPVKGSKLN